MNNNEYAKPQLGKELLEMAQDARDIRDADAALAALSTGEDEAIPGSVATRLLSGDEHPLKIWREYRGFTQESLGNEAGIGKSYVSQIEAGAKMGSTQVLGALAKALKVDIDDLLQ